MQRSCFLAVAGLFIAFAAAPCDEPVIRGKGWEYDRAELRWPDWIDKEKQQSLRATGSLQGPNGWIEFDIDIPDAGWYELYIGGTPPEWPRDLFVDGRSEARLGVSDSQRDRRETDDKRKPLYKEVNLFFSKGKHKLRFRRRGFPGALPGVWELHPAAGNPVGCVRARVRGNPIAVPGQPIELDVMGGTRQPTAYVFLLRDLMTDKLTESSTVEFPATAQPQAQRVEITLPVAGLYSIEARAGDSMLRPSDVKAGLVLAAEPPAAPEPATGAVELAAPFTEGAVLQRNVPVPVWGWARAGETINVALAGCTAQTVANADGTWRVVLGPLQAGGPHRLEVKGEGQRSLTVEDVLVGEVWLLSGQSNMGGPLLMSIGGEEAAATADFPHVRVFNTHADPDGRIRRFGWMTAQSNGDPSRLRSWLGIHFGFATSLHRELGVPIGLISAARGGTVISTWTSVQAHRDNDVLRPMLESHERRVAEFAKEKAHVLDVAGQIAKWRREAAAAVANGDPPPRPAEISGQIEKNNAPGKNFEALIRPLAPFPIRGICWYQGESDSQMADAYAERFAIMVRQWRQLWEAPELPFVYAQIALAKGIDHEGPPREADGEMRDVQLKCLQIPNTAMIVTYDLFRPDDDVHYKDKTPVGRRFALAALHLAYGWDTPYSGPICREARVEGGQIRLFFDHLCGGLEARGGPLGGFCIAGADRKWTWADARIDDDTVIVSSSQVAQPAAVRYAWSKYRCGANLYNKAGLPTPTFRTDTWPLTSKGTLVIEKD